MTAPRANAAGGLRWALFSLLAAGTIGMFLATILAAFTIPGIIITSVLLFVDLVYMPAACIMAARGSRHDFSRGGVELFFLILHFIGWLSYGVVIALTATVLGDVISLADEYQGDIPAGAQSITFQADEHVVQLAYERTTGLAVGAFMLLLVTMVWGVLLIRTATRVVDHTWDQALGVPAHFLMSGEVLDVDAMMVKKTPADQMSTMQHAEV